MLTILGPAKTINTDPHEITQLHTFPEYLDHSSILVEKLRGYSVGELEKLMKASFKIAELNADRYARWKPDYRFDEGHHALLAFQGEVFNGLQARSLSEEDLLFGQEHVRILSGLYGVLRPLDVILPYRLEMGTRMKNVRGKDLYTFWDEVIPAEIRRLTGEFDPPVLINLASGEYFRSISPSGFPHRVITPVFKEPTENGYRNVTIYAKKARGLMLRFILQNRITDPEHLKAFDLDGYYYNGEHSAETDWWFTR